MSDLSAADVLAMTRNGGEGSGFLEGNGIIILILFFLMFSGGLGGYGAAGGNFTRAEMQDGFNNQNVVNTLNNMSIAMNNGFSGITLGMNNGFNGVTAGIANLGYQMQQNCCDLKTQINLQGDLTRQLIQNNTMQDLRDKLNEKDRAIQSANFDASQTAQTASIEAFILANK